MSMISYVCNLKILVSRDFTARHGSLFKSYMGSFTIVYVFTIVQKVIKNMKKLD